MSLRPPATSRSPSPANDSGRAATARQSLGPSTRGNGGLVPSSPRPGGISSNARPTSELLGGSGLFQTPEAEALDQWFENLQSYEATLEEMAAASLDVNFKEELSAIEQWFKVLSEAERTAALYSLLQHSTQVQIRFFITVLQQMARSDPMTALLSPAMGGSMQSQMEAKLASMKSPGLKSGLPASPTTRNFSGTNRQSLVLDNSSNYLSPDSAANPPPSADAAATLAQQRAKFKANNAANAAHRISAPVLSSPSIGDGRPTTWGSQLSQLAEQNGPAQEISIGSRPKSTEFVGSPRPSNGEVTLPPSDSWASMVNTPLIPMFQKENRLNTQSLDAASNKLNDWNKSAAPGVPMMGDPTIHKRSSKSSTGNDGRDVQNSIYDENGNVINAQNQNRGGGNMRNANLGAGAPGGANWSGTRSPGLPGSSSNNGRYDDGAGNLNSMNGLGMQMGGFGMSPLGMPNMGGMPPMSPFNNMLSAMGISPEAQLLAAQMAAANGFGQANWLGMQPQSAGLNNNNRRHPPKSATMKSPNSAGSGGTPKAEDDVDPQLLHDIPAWLRSLRLHKYTPNFEGMKWQDMVVLDEAALEAKGVAALGARRKMLKTFELVRKKMGIDGGPPQSGSAVGSP
ncbi:hypothetical protein EDD18DRAFT_1456874 [Armillaria luteobubalina]|uniref:RNA-binding protein VTS1 n=1 Tax=Armillaria luteobubalina TaxID=153913 RepID=A0AA39QIQ6_9AGAR|nr:hypothetical protein EDD18DRAFT_1456874 [Armillaria luteobubalina]